MSQLTDMIPEAAPDYHTLLHKMAADVNADPYCSDILQEMGAILVKAEEVYEASLVKTAAWKGADFGNTAKGVGMRMATTVGAMALGGIAMALAGDLYESAKRGLTRGRDYRAMLSANPDLNKPGNAAKVQSSFSTLHRFNPEFAKDPNVAGSYVRNALEYPDSEMSTVKDLVKARADMSKSVTLPSFGGVKDILQGGGGGGESPAGTPPFNPTGSSS